MKKLFTLTTLGLLLISTSSWSMMRAGQNAAGDDDAALQRALELSAAEYAAVNANNADDDAALAAFAAVNADANADPDEDVPAAHHDDDNDEDDAALAFRLQAEETAPVLAGGVGGVNNQVADDDDAGLYDDVREVEPQKGPKTDEQLAIELFCEMNKPNAERLDDVPNMAHIINAARHVGAVGHAEQPGEDEHFAMLLFAQLNPRGRNAGRPLPQPPVRPVQENKAADDHADAAPIVAAPIDPPPAPPLPRAVVRPAQERQQAGDGEQARNGEGQHQALFAGIRAGFALQPVQQQQNDDNNNVDNRNDNPHEALMAAIKNAAGVLRDGDAAQAEREANGVVDNAERPLEVHDAHLAAIHAGIALRRAADRVLAEKRDDDGPKDQVHVLHDAIQRALKERRPAVASADADSDDDDDDWDE